MWFPPLTDAESDAVRDSLGDAYAGVDRAASPSRTALSFFGIDRQTSSLKLAGTFIISSGMSIREAIEYLKRTGVLMYSGEPPRVIHGVTSQGPKEETMSQAGTVKIRVSNDGKTWSEFDLTGPIHEPSFPFRYWRKPPVDQPPTDPRWEAVPPMYYDAWYCTQDYPGKTDCCGALAQHALPDRDPDGSITGGAGACDACWIAGRREPLERQTAKPIPELACTEARGQIHCGKPAKHAGPYVFGRHTGETLESYRKHLGLLPPAEPLAVPLLCRLGLTCPMHYPKKPDPFIPEVSDMDLLPDASPMFLGGVRYRR